MSNRTSHIEYVAKVKKTVKVADPVSRKKKADKIISVLRDYSETRRLILGKMSCLDIGCSTCMITVHLTKYFKRVVGFDPDLKALQLAGKSLEPDPKLKKVVGDGLTAPFPDESFDVIICNQIYEHVPDPEKLFSEIFRLLKQGGFCYLSAGNRLMIMEPHYKLPFLSWLPLPLANMYLKLTRGVDVYREKHFSYWGIKQLLHEFEITDYTVKVLKDPERFNLNDMIGKNSPIPGIPAGILKLIEPIIPYFIMVLRKPEENS